MIIQFSWMCLLPIARKDEIADLCTQNWSLTYVLSPNCFITYWEDCRKSPFLACFYFQTVTLEFKRNFCGKWWSVVHHCRDEETVLDFRGRGWILSNTSNNRCHPADLKTHQGRYWHTHIFWFSNNWDLKSLNFIWTATSVFILLDLSKQRTF